MEQDNNHDGGKDRRSVLRVVVENPRKWRTRQFQPADKFPFILPPVDLDARHEFQYRAMGMKSAQVNLAWRIAHKDRHRYEAYFKASERVWLLWQLLTIAIDQERRETLAILLAHYPAAYGHRRRQLVEFGTPLSDAHDAISPFHRLSPVRSKCPRGRKRE